MAHNSTSKAFLCVALLGLSACGGGEDVAVGPDPVEDFLAAQTAFLDQSAAIGFSNNTTPTPTPPADITITSGATYSGPIGLIVRSSGDSSDIPVTEATLSTEGMVGDITMTVAFSNNGAISGVADNFIRADGADVGGSLTIASTLIGITQTAVSVNPTAVSGTLTGTPLGTVTLNGTAFGGFGGPDADIWGQMANNTGTVFRGQWIASED